MQRKNIILLSLLLVGIVLLLISINTALYVGAPFFNERAHDEWHMNNYIVIPAFYAFIFCSFLAWWLGGVFTGASIVAAHQAAKRHTKYVILLIFLAIGLCALGFNTFDFMLGCFYWTGGAEPTPILVDFMLFSFNMNAWNYYFFVFLAPLWISGFCIGFAIVAKFLRLKI